MGGAEEDRKTLVEQIAREETHLAHAEEARERAEKRLSDLRRQLAAKNTARSRTSTTPETENPRDRVYRQEVCP